MLLRGFGRAERHPAPGGCGGWGGVPARALFVLLLLVPGPVRAQFAVYPAIVEFDASGGGQTITVENQGEAAMDLRIYAMDYDRAEGGEHVYFPHGEHEGTCAGRLEVFPDQLSLGSGEAGELRIRMAAGTGTCWGALFVEKRTLTPSGITIAQRVGVKVLTEGAGTVPEGRVLGMAADTTSDPAALVAFENQGTGFLEVGGEIEARDLNGDIVGVVELEELRVLPGHVRRVRGPLTELGLAPGRYVLVAVLDFGADYLVGGQTMIAIEP